MTTRAAFGTWKSPVSTDLITRDSVRLSATSLDHGSVYWIESRPSEGGRYALMTWSDETRTPVELVHDPYNVRTRAHEYGGGAYLVSGKLVIFHQLRRPASLPNGVSEKRRRRSRQTMALVMRISSWMTVELASSPYARIMRNPILTPFPRSPRCHFRLITPAR